MDVSEVFNTMEYGPAPESPAAVEAWLDDHGRKFGLFIDNEWAFLGGVETYPSYNPANGEKLADTVQAGQAEVDQAVAAARRAFQTWSKTPGLVRARYLYAIARNIQKHHRLLAVLESMDNGKPLRESRDIDVPLLARHFYYYAGWAQLMESELPEYQPVGVVGQIIPWNFPTDAGLEDRPRPSPWATPWCSSQLYTRLSVVVRGVVAKPGCHLGCQ
jgi:aldehyde dehydrogenase (NAD+)